MSLRLRPWSTGFGAVLVVAVAVVAAAAWAGTRAEPTPTPAAVPLEQACRLVLAYREAEVGPAVLAARADLRSVVHGLPADGTPAQLAVRAYADATLGPPTAGPARYLEGADAACRRLGVPLYAW